MPIDKELGNTEASEIFTGGPNQTKIAATITNALVEGKPMADDGNIHDSIQTAEQAANSWVFIPPGQFNESVTINTAGLRIIGSGYDSLINGGTSGDAVSSTVSDVTLSNLRLETDNQQQDSRRAVYLSGSNSKVIDCWITESDSDHVVLGDDSIIARSYLSDPENTGDNGINLGTRGIATNCILEGVATGVTTYPDGISMNSDCIISNNIVKSSGDNTSIHTGNDCVCIGNRIVNGLNVGIRAGGSNTIIANNRISSSNTEIKDSGTGTLKDGNLTGPAN